SSLSLRTTCHFRCLVSGRAYLFSPRFHLSLVKLVKRRAWMRWGYESSVSRRRGGDRKAHQARLGGGRLPSGCREGWAERAHDGPGADVPPDSAGRNAAEARWVERV